LGVSGSFLGLNALSKLKDTQSSRRFETSIPKTTA
jgi:hypothetical protein